MGNPVATPFDNLLDQQPQQQQQPQQTQGQPQSSPAQPQQVPTPFDDLLSQAQPTQTQQPQSLVDQLGAQFQPDLDLLKGAGKGVLDTIHGTGELIRKGGNLVKPGLGDSIVPPSGQHALDLAATSSNTAQSVGKTAEGLAEFLLGDEAIKGLSLGDKLLKVSQVAEKYEKATPFVKNTLDYVMNVARGSAAGAGEEAVKSGGDAGKTEEGALLGAAGEGVAKPVLGAIGKGAGSVASKAKALLTDVPAETESKLVDALGDIAEKNGLELPEGTSTARDAVKSLGDAYQQRAQSVYQQLDKDVPGFQDLREEMLNSQKQAKAYSQIDPEKSSNFQDTADDLRDKLNDLLSDDQKNAWDSANADYTRFKALQRVQGKVAGAGEDLNSDELTNPGRLQAGFRGLVNATKNSRPIDYVQRAFGDDADSILKVVQEGANLADEKKAAQKLVGWLAPKLAGAGIAGAAGYGGYKLAKALSGDH